MCSSERTVSFFLLIEELEQVARMNYFVENLLVRLE